MSRDPVGAVEKCDPERSAMRSAGAMVMLRAGLTIGGWRGGASESAIRIRREEALWGRSRKRSEHGRGIADQCSEAGGKARRVRPCVSAARFHSAGAVRSMSRVGFEPTTYGLKVRCSTS